MKTLLLIYSMALALCPAVPSAAQERPAPPRQGSDSIDRLPPDQAAAHRELIAFRVGVTAAFNKAGASGGLEDMVALLEYADPDILFTDMTGESLRGREALLSYFKREFIDEGHSLRTMQSEFTADHLSLLMSPDVALNKGTGVGRFTFVDGKELTVNTKWTATLVRRSGVWKLSAFHFSPPLFDNPVVDAYRGWIYKAAGIAVIVALPIGILIGRAMRKP